jgi:hypothetical protein
MKDRVRARGEQQRTPRDATVGLASRGDTAGSLCPSTARSLSSACSWSGAVPATSGGAGRLRSAAAGRAWGVGHGWVAAGCSSVCEAAEMSANPPKNDEWRHYADVRFVLIRNPGRLNPSRGLILDWKRNHRRWARGPRLSALL